MKKSEFYALSFTWGLPLTLIGCIVALVLIVTGHKPKKWGWCWYFEIGKSWGGLNLGVFFLTSRNLSEHIKNHEHGHAVQNCFFGAAMLFIVLWSGCRYWWRTFKTWAGVKNLPPYDSIWFEGQATALGWQIMSKM